MLKQLPGDLGKECANDLLGRIGAGGAKGVAAQWELLVLYALAKSDQLELLPKREGSRRPDAVFRCAATGQKTLVEVTAMSDEYLEDQYPDRDLPHLLYKALLRLIKKHIGVFNLFLSLTMSNRTDQS